LSGNEGYRCKECGLTFPTEEQLEKHAQEHMRLAEVFNCEKCKKTFSSREELDKHLLEDHKE
jgi:DNA-directed RNA polymerase subunit RPC12/RpoP